MFKLIGMIGKSCIVDMLDKNDNVQVIIYDDSVRTMDKAIIISPSVGIEEMLQGISFQLAKEQRSRLDEYSIIGNQYVIIYTNLNENVISKREKYIEEIEKQYKVNIIVTCKPNRRY